MAAPLSSPKAFEVPKSDPIVEKSSGTVSLAWNQFFLTVRRLLRPLGEETIVNLENFQTIEADIKGLYFDKRYQSHAIVEYLIQRITTGTGATELVASGELHAVYKPISDKWVLRTPLAEGPDSSGVTLSVTDAGQGQYKTTNMTGTAFISRIIFRVRTLSGKHSFYSVAGG